MIVGLCCIVKNENKYLKEYVEYYLNLGFDKIIIGDNNDILGEQVKDVVKESEKVTIINVRGQKKIQCRFYEDCYRKFKDVCDWMAFFDADEFLELNNHNNIKDFLSDNIFLAFNCIRVNWRNVGDNGLIGYENNFDRSIVKRFKNKTSEWHLNENMTKAIVRCKSVDEIKFLDPHIPLLKATCNSVGEEINGNLSFCKPNYNGAILNHYRKTILEFIETKLNRGWADENTSVINFKEHFLKYNKLTKEKTDIINKYNNHE